MKKISIVIITAAILSACGAPVAPTKTPSVTQVAGKTPKPTNIVETASRIQVAQESLNGLEISIWYPWFGVEASLFEAMVDDFNGTNEWGIKADAIGQSNFSLLYESVMTALPTQDKPHLVIALPEHAIGWDADGVLADLTPYVEDPFYGIDYADFPSVILDQDRLGERRVAFPAQRTVRLLLWNETWAGELGFDSAPESSNEFRQQACRAHQTMLSDQTPNNDGRGGWILDTESMTAYAWLLAFEGGVLEGNDYRFLTPNNISAFEFLKKLTEDQCAWQASSGAVFSDFATRQALFITASLEDLPSVTREFATADNTDTWTVHPYPGDNSGALVIYGSSYVIMDSSPEEQLAAWLFIRWMLEPKQDARLVEATHLFPLRSSTMELLTAYRNSHPQWAEAVSLLPDGELQPQLASWRMVKVMLGDGFTDMFRRTDLTSGQVAKVLQQMQDIAQELNQ
jgi:multiple sugar transport system substrate-binding protein